MRPLEEQGCRCYYEPCLCLLRWLAACAVKLLQPCWVVDRKEARGKAIDRMAKKYAGKHTDSIRDVNCNMEHNAVQSVHLQRFQRASSAFSCQERSNGPDRVEIAQSQVHS